MTDEPALWELPPEGRPRVECQVCGGALTDSVSRRWGLGPDCRTKLQVHSAPRPTGFDVKQEALPGF